MSAASPLPANPPPCIPSPAFIISVPIPNTNLVGCFLILVMEPWRFPQKGSISFPLSPFPQKRIHSQGIGGKGESSPLGKKRPDRWEESKRPILAGWKNFRLVERSIEDQGRFKMNRYEAKSFFQLREH
ncbi:hypothetical protein LINPERHAP2_LOCUS29920 [Linum perenne]